MIYSATDRCLCGAGLAHEHSEEPWQCSAVLRGTSDKQLRHGYASAGGVASESHPAAAGRNTRDVPPALQVITGTEVERG